MRRFIRLLCAAVIIVTAMVGVGESGTTPQTTDRPNILWFVVDDMSANFGCYGETRIATPHVDRLAVEGCRFS